MYQNHAVADMPGVPEMRLPLTEAQQEIWYASQMSAGASLAYLESSTLRLSGKLSVAALRRALRLLVARHEALRTRIGGKGDVQHVLEAGDPEFTLAELPGDTIGGLRDLRIQQWLGAQVQQPFNLAGGPLFRSALLKVDEQTHLFSLIVHHVICDGWSLGILTRELGRLYAAEREGRNAGLPAAPTLTTEIERQLAERKSPAFAAARDYWARQFADAAPWLELPTDRLRPANRTYRGALIVHTLPEDVSAALKKLCSAFGCTLFTGVLASFCVLIHRLTGQDDVVIGIPSATQVMGGLGGLVGNFANLLPFRSRVADHTTFSAHLRRVREQLAGALEHWRFPFSKVLELLNLPRDPSRVPLAPLVFNSTGTHLAFDFGGLSAEAQPAPKHFVNFDLNFNFGVRNGALVLGCYYSTELYDKETIHRWFGNFETLLRGIVAEPEGRIAEMPLLTVPEQRLLREWNDTAMAFRRDATVTELFDEQVARSPQALAVVAGGERLSYIELARSVDAVAARLVALGLKAEAPVGVLLERNAWLPAAMLGVLKAGGAYVPLDPMLPRQRLDFMVEDAGIKVIVTQQNLIDRIPAASTRLVVVDAPGAASPPTNGAVDALGPVGPEHLAYIIYTSGSTGKPKGVCVTHRNVVALVAWAQRQFSPEELDGVLFATSASFDVSIFESLAPLLLGGKIVVAENILQIAAASATEEIRMISGVPSAITEVLRAGLIPGTARSIVLAGECCPQSLVDSLLENTAIVRVYDLYGPTETTVYSCGGIRRAGGRPTIGRPLPNERIHILDARLQPVPIGVCGTIYIGGEKVARGYLNRAQLTRQNFIASSLDPAGRIYRTGDRGRFYPDGSIEFLGRLDAQVKVRGFRIEIGEIEAVLRQHPAVVDCVVSARQDSAGVTWLAGYVVSATRDLSPPVLQDHLRQHLPEYMIPAAWMLLDKLPLTTNGKIDRRALPAPEMMGGVVAYVAPRTATEEIVAEIWREVLELRQVGLDHNFFEMGGHSLRASQVVTRLNQVFGIELSMRQFFHAPTVSALSAVVDRALVDDIQESSAQGAALGDNAPPALLKE